jgi:hypothetical protein
MAQQILANSKKISILPRPHETGIVPRDVLVESIKVDTRFEGSAVDAVATIKSTLLVVYMTCKSRPVPEALSGPDCKNAGVLEINLEKLWRLAETSESHRVGKSDFERVLVEDVDAKKRIFHPAQRRSAKLVGWDQIEAPEAQIPSDPAQHDAPLIVRFECQLCFGTWYAGGSETDANGTALHFGVALVAAISLAPTLAWL